MNLKKIAMSLVTAGAAGGLLVSGTFAFFTDQGSSNDNVFTAGTLIMKLSDDNETDQDTVTATWGFTNAVPGASFTGTLNIKSTGTVNAGFIDLSFVNTVTDNPDASSPGNVSTTPMDTVIEITSFTWDSNGDGTGDVDLLSYVNDNNSNAIKDLDDVAATTLENLPYGGTQTANHPLVINGKLHTTKATNEHQGDQVSTALSVNMDQAP